MPDTQGCMEEAVGALLGLQQDVFDTTDYAAAVLSMSLTSERRILVAGTTLSAPILEIFSRELNIKTLNEKGLAGSKVLNHEAGVLGLSTNNLGLGDLLKATFNAEACCSDNGSDSLLIVSDAPENALSAFGELLEAAHHMHVPAVVICTQKDKISGLLNDEDICIRLNIDSSYNFLTAALSLLFCIKKQLEIV